MSSLQGKKVLFFAPKFFNYEVAIKEEIEKQGAEVHLYDERNSPSTIEKFLMRKAHFLITKKINSYFFKIALAETSFKPDYILFVNPEAVTEKSLIYLKKTFSNAKLILYMWDSLKNKKVKNLLPLFDKKLSFDKDDCTVYSMHFRPLFYTPQFEASDISVNKNVKYDFAFVGTIHSDRAKILNQLRKYFDSNNYSYFYYCYIQSKLILFARWLMDKNVREMKQFVHLESISKKEITDIYNQSEYIIDINHPKQTGLTMRTIEMIGLKKKFVTTNKHIHEYDFYNDKNQLVLTRGAQSILHGNVTKAPYENISIDIYKNYSLHSWVQYIFEK